MLLCGLEISFISPGVYWVYWEPGSARVALGSVLSSSSPSLQVQVILHGPKAVCDGRGRAGVSWQRKAPRALAVVPSGLAAFSGWSQVSHYLRSLMEPCG